LFTSAMDRCPAAAAWVGCGAVAGGVVLVVAFGDGVRVGVGVPVDVRPADGVADRTACAAEAETVGAASAVATAAG
jgi:hypothetical protein